MPLFRSLKSRFIWATCIALLGVLVVGGFVIHSAVENRLQTQFDHGLTDKLRFFEASCFIKESGNLTFGMLQTDWESLQDPADPDYFQFHYANGEPIYASRNLVGSELPALKLPDGSPRLGNTELPGGRPGRFASVKFYPPLRVDGEWTGEKSPNAVHVTVAHDATMLTAALQELGTVLVSVGVGMAVVILGVTWLVAHTGLRPLETLRSQIDTISIGQSQRFTSEQMPEELTPVVSRLNALMERAGSTLQHEREFTSNVAHELRTPLAVIRAQLESILMDESVSPDTESRVLEALSTEEELERSVENLLWLARLDRGLDRFDAEEVEVGRFMRRCWRPFLDAADAKGLRVEWNLRKAPTLACSPDLLRVLLRNLYENAVAYTPESGSISISGTNGVAPVTISVKNSCAGVGARDLSELFARSDRSPVPSSDTSDSVSPAHLGIGLALSRRIAGVLGGELTASSSAPDEIEFRFQLTNSQHINN